MKPKLGTTNIRYSYSIFQQFVDEAKYWAEKKLSYLNVITRKNIIPSKLVFPKMKISLSFHSINYVRLEHWLKLTQIRLLQQLFQSGIFHLLLPQLFFKPLNHFLRFFQLSFQQIRICHRGRHNYCLCHVWRRLRRFDDETWFRYRRRRHQGGGRGFLWLDGDGGVNPHDLEGAGGRPVVEGVVRDVAGHQFAF